MHSGSVVGLWMALRVGKNGKTLIVIMAPLHLRPSTYPTTDTPVDATSNLPGLQRASPLIDGPFFFPHILYGVSLAREHSQVHARLQVESSTMQGPPISRGKRESHLGLGSPGVRSLLEGGSPLVLVEGSFLAEGSHPVGRIPAVRIPVGRREAVHSRKVVDPTAGITYKK
jgi:hypothetical protein